MQMFFSIKAIIKINENDAVHSNIKTFENNFQFFQAVTYKKTLAHSLIWVNSTQKMKTQLKESKCNLTLSLIKAVIHKLIEFLDKNNDCHQAISQI